MKLSLQNEQKHECLRDMTARTYKDRITRNKCLENYGGVIWNEW